MESDDNNWSGLFERLTDEQKKEIDEWIYANRILEGMKRLREHFSITLHESMFMFHWRHDQLHELAPARFRSTPEQYWYGFIS